MFDVMIQRSAAGACLSTLSNAPSTAAKPAADWPSFRAVSWIRSKDGKRSRILAAAVASTLAPSRTQGLCTID